MITWITNLLDSPPFRVFFAAWTGVYLIQVLKGEEGGPDVSEVWWIVVAAAFAIFLI